MKRRVVAWIVLLAGTLFCRVGYLDNVFYNVDEAEYAVAADALAQGELPGVDLLGSTKPPGIAILYLKLFVLFGRSLSVIHLAQLVIFFLMGVLVVETTIALWGLAGALPAAILFWMIGNSFSLPAEMLALNVELPGMLFVMAGLLLGLKRRWLLAGLLLGIGALFRQSMVVFLIPVVLWWWTSGTRQWRSFEILLAGSLFSGAVVIAIYGLHGGLATALDSWFVYPAVYASDVGITGFFTAMGLNLSEFAAQCFLPLAIAIVGKVILIRRESKREKLFVFSLAAVSFLALCSGSRFYGHYFYQIFPVVALAGVPGWIWLQSNGKWLRRSLTTAIAIGSLIALVHFPLWPYWDASAPRDGVPEASLNPARLERHIGEFVKENTPEDARIVVWGYCPQIYFYAERLPGVRDYMCHYATGFSTGSFDSWTEKPYRSDGYQGAREQFADDLRQNRPTYLIDIASINHYEYTFHMLPLADFPQIQAAVDSLYTLDRTLGPVRIWKLSTHL